MTGAELREFRRRLGFNQTELAAELGVRNNSVCRWESQEAAEINPVVALALEEIKRRRQAQPWPGGQSASV